MNKKIFRSTLLVALVVLFASVVLILGILLDFFERQIRNELKSEAAYISHAIQTSGPSFFENLESPDKRITLISPDGNVIADTSGDDAITDNQANHEEIRKALSSGEGTSIRYSGTRTEKTIYYAIRLDDGNVLRVSTTQFSAFTILLGLLHPMIFVFVIAFILSLVLSYRISSSIVKPINSLNLDNPTACNTYEELSPLLSKIAAQGRIIERRIKEERRKREEFLLITENMSEGFLTLDEVGNILTYNSAALRLLGMENPDGANLLTFNCAGELRTLVSNVLDGNRTECEISLNGKIYNIIANPVFDEGKVIGAIIIILDITEEHGREQLRREFTSNVSHELKTPLTSISGFAEIMKSGETDPSTVVDFSSSIYDEAQRLITLVSDIIKLSELDEGSVQIDKETVDLYELSCEIVSRLSSNAEKAAVMLSVSGVHAEICGARKILDEMIYNLCDNAIKYNRRNGRADILISEDEASVKLTVSDTGIGIPASEQSRVFERFYRVDKSHSKDVGGTGLGLSIVKHGSIYHNASIDLDSTPEKGTAITVTFKKSCDV
ncbi:MAG: PAS domain-containing protein [Oscillospiraceae bacterium]|nr:PAS domain-containing protein [Oscillospiraceae bacterium]